MSEHLPILREMFPNKIMLDVDDIAKAISHSVSHVYNLCSPEMVKKTGKKLPFELFKGAGSDKILASIVEVAHYLDGSITPIEKEPSNVPAMVKPKRGRPIGSGRVSRLEAQFRQELSMAVVRYQAEEAFNALIEEIEAVEFQDNQKPCSDKFEGLKSDAVLSAKRARSSLMATMLGMQLPITAKPKPLGFKKV